MLKRDEKRLRLASKYDVLELFVNTETGRIVGMNIYTSMKFFDMVVDFSHVITLTIEEYKWMTDETRSRTVTTAADLYDKVEWTSGGFVIGGYKIKYREKEVLGKPD